MELRQVWTQVFNIVRQELPVPTVWLAMQAALPLTIDGNYFVAGLPRQDEYLANHLQDNQASTAIEGALHRVTGRILAFRLIQGESVADWEAQKALGDDDEPMDLPEPMLVSVPPPASSPIAEPPPAFFRSESSPAPAPAPPKPAPPASRSPLAEAAREVSPTWEKLNERLSHGFKTAPFVKYPHGQAQFVLAAVKVISDTMDVMMPASGAPRDDHQERMLARVVERLGSIINLDPMFLSLELFRYRQSQGKNPDTPF